MQNKNNTSNNQIKALESQLNKLKLEIQNYKPNINIPNNINNNSNNFVMPLLPGEKRLEEKLNNAFPMLKKHEAYFLVNTRRIKRFQTLDENKIKNDDAISVFLITA